MAIKFLNSVAVDTDVLFVDTANERVGIGTTSPDYKLDVAGTFRVKHANSAVAIQEYSNGATIWMDGVNGDFVGGDYFNISAYGATDLAFGHGAATKMTLKNTGNLGIGTTSPGAKLEVVVADDTFNDVNVLKLKRIWATGSGSDRAHGVSFTDNNSTLATIYADRTNSGANYNSDLLFATNTGASGTSLSTRMIIKHTGNVGIGTSFPDEMLHIENSLGANIILNSNTGAVNNGIYMSEGASSTPTQNGAYFYYDSSANAVKLDTGTSSLSTKLIVLRDTGNVGIGTTSPSYKLDVNGIIRSENSSEIGTLYLGNTAQSQIPGGAIIGQRSSYSSTGKMEFQVPTWGANTDYGLTTQMTIEVNTSDTKEATISMIPFGGNVGIGTTSPDKLLELSKSVQGGQGATLRLTNAVGGSGAGTAVEFVGPGTQPIHAKIITEDAGAFDSNIIFQTKATGTGGALADRLTIDNVGAIQFNDYGAGTLITDSSGNITVSSGGGAGGPYLPLAGGTMTGSIKNGDGVYSYWGTGDDLQIGHDGSNSYIIDKGVGDLLLYYSDDFVVSKYGTSEISIRANQDSSVELFFDNSKKFETTTDGTLITGGWTTTGNSITYGNIHFPDGRKAEFGTSQDLQMYHDGTNSYIKDSGTGVLNIQGSTVLNIGGTNGEVGIQYTENAGITLRHNNVVKFTTISTGVTVTGDTTADQFISTNNGNGQNYKIGDDVWIGDINVANTFRVQGAANPNNAYITFGNLSNTALGRTGTGALTWGGAFEATTSVTSPTFLGDLNGTINTVTTAVTKVNATNDTTVATTAFVQNLIGTIPAGLVFQGTWNAATNTPTLTSGSGTTGHFYIVSTSGSTNLDGVTDWVTGDWAVFIEQGATDAWEKIDNSSVLDGAGTGQTLPLWSGSGTSNTLTNSKLVQNTAGTLITAFTNSTGNTGNFITNSEGGGEVGLTVQSRTNRAKLRVADNDSNAYVVAEAGKAFYGTSANADPANITVLTSGKVGIGTTGPDAKLQVAGDFRLGDGAYTSIDFNADPSSHQGNGGLEIKPSTVPGSGTANWYTRFASNVATGTTNHNVTIDGNVGIGTASPTFKLDVAGTANIDTHLVVPLIYSGGGNIVFGNVAQFNDRVGINTTSPAYKLDVDETTSGNLIVSRFKHNQSGVASAMQLENRAGAVNSAFDINWGLNAAGNQGTVGVIRTNLPAAGGSEMYFKTSYGEVMRLDGAGNVGIGTTSPSYKLSVSGNIGLTDGVSTGLLALVGGNYYIQNTGAYSTVFQTNGAERMRITSAGDTGIGVTTPRAKLDVAGGIKVADDTDTAGANKVGTLRYRTSGNNSYVDMCMQTGASTYAWINVVQNNW